MIVAKAAGERQDGRRSGGAEGGEDVGDGGADQPVIVGEGVDELR